MVRKKRNKQEEEDETREKSTVKKAPCCGCDLNCTTCEVNGAETLRKAACRTLKQLSEVISKKLADKAKTGDANCTKLLLLLTEGQQKKADARKIKRGRSAALALAAEPEWSDEMIETITAPGSESWEPEG
jgi:hypothetical protein